MPTYEKRSSDKRRDSDGVKYPTNEPAGFIESQPFNKGGRFIAVPKRAKEGRKLKWHEEKENRK